MSDLQAETVAAPPAHVPAHLIRDWGFDDPTGVETDPFAAFAPLYEGPDIFWSPRARSSQAAWVVTRHDLITEIAHDTATFSSRFQSGFSQLVGEDWDLIPLEKDPPDHGLFRVILNPLFSPTRVLRIEETVRATAERLVQAMEGRRSAEFIAEFARPFPVSIFLGLMGLPLDQTPMFEAWEKGLLHGENLQARIDAAAAIKLYLVEAIADRRKRPTDDLISFTVTSRVEGRLLTDEEILGICYLLFVAGLDTVAAMLGLMFKHLADDQANQKLLRDEPGLRPAAIEECLRAFNPTMSSRRLTRDIEFHGVPMKAGDRVVLSWTMSTRDDREFPDPHKVDFRRQNLRHTTFAVGPHRCIGSHLARRELKIALDLILERIPTFRIAPGERAVTHATGVVGVTSLPLAW